MPQAAAQAAECGRNAAGNKAVESKPAPQTIKIPAGTVITVRLGETLSSKSSSAGQGFSATVAEPVVVDGKSVIEKGAAARGSVVDAKSMGHFKGGALLEVRLNSVSIHGRETSVKTSMIARSVSRQRQTLSRIHCGGAGAGALMAHCRRRERRSHRSNSWGSAGTVGATGNKEIVLPAKRPLTFKLKQPVEVR